MGGGGGRGNFRTILSLFLIVLLYRSVKIGSRINFLLNKGWQYMLAIEYPLNRDGEIRV